VARLLVFWKEPAKQSEHTALELAVHVCRTKRPTPQSVRQDLHAVAVCVTSFWKVPAPQATQTGVSVALQCPWRKLPVPHDATQLAQLLRPTLLANEPAEHAVQVVEFKLEENVPRGQLSHAVAPELVWNEPGWQGRHTGECGVLTKPAGHNAHCRLLIAEGATDSYSFPSHTVSGVQASVELVAVHSPVR
jgi:hypothetical protein